MTTTHRSSTTDTKRSEVEVQTEDMPLRIEMIHDKDPETRFLPMTATPKALREIWERNPGQYEDYAEAIDYFKACEAAGIPSLPLYESKAREAGLKWRVVA